MLATGSEPELHRLVLSKYRRGQLPFPVVIEPIQAQSWDDKAYLASMRPDPETEEREQIKEIRRAHRAGKHTIRALTDETGYFTQRVSYLVHKYSMPLRNEYWRAEKYDNPNEVITGQTVELLGDKLGAPSQSIRQASYSNGIVCGYYISRVPKV
uniref:Prophage Lp2 protein 23 n=1 Tax=Lactiplantibacillus pentosus MP-10 TaxID=1028490 RepID=F6IZU3_LACPE|nr:prophage Lp2 protein 23 [Lactiplantibacillus pentosus MP-10]